MREGFHKFSPPTHYLCHKSCELMTNIKRTYLIAIFIEKDSAADRELRE